MPNNFKSPYATTFKNAVKRGTSWNTAVHNIAKRSNTTPQNVWNSLHKAGLCYRQKFNGQWVYWPVEAKKGNATTWKNSQHQMWQWFCEWAMINGVCKPDQLCNNTGSQMQFMTYCRKFFNKQFSGTTTSSSSRTKTRRTGSKTKSYTFPKRRTTTRRYRRAA
jgi:hypothetical protein